MSHLRKYRKHIKYSQKKLGMLAGFSQSAISHYGTCKRTSNISNTRKIVTTLNSLKVTCSYFGVSPTTISYIA